MIGWILDLMFSNLWLILILYWLFTSITKAGKKTRETAERTQQNKPIFSAPEQQAWDIDIEEPRYPLPDPVMQAPPAPKEAARQTTSPPIATKTTHQEEPSSPEENPQRSRRQGAGGPPLATPAQGMIWSQVFGPPRSKQPHRPFRRS